MRKLLTPEENKAILVEILDVIDAFCRQNGIKYSLTGGTLLGAIRHKGFIPWDDDLDLTMPRPDYDRFRKTFKADGYTLADLSLRNDCVEAFVKVCKDGTVQVDKNFGRELWGVNVDVFPLDGAPSEGLAEHYAAMDTLRQKAFQICPYYKSVKKGRFALKVKYALKRLRYFYPGSFMSLKKKLVENQKAIPYETASVVGPYYWVEKTRAFLPKPVFDELGTVTFEGKEYLSVKDYDTLLKALFGDYMQLPPVEKRVSHHAYDSYIEL